jgi:hypothetical protein
MRFPAALASGPFTAAEAAALGVGRGVLSGPSVRRLFNGVYITAGREPDLVDWVRAAEHILPPNTVATGVTALHLMGVLVGPAMPLRFLNAHQHQVRQPQIQVARTAELPTNDGHTVCAAHAFVAAAPDLDLAGLVAAGDWLVRLRLTSPPELRGYADNHRDKGIALARRAAGLVRARVDSPRESMLRLCLILAGLPEPEINIVIGTDDYPIGRVDLLYRAFKVILEYEGDQHRTDRTQWNLDIYRADEFQAEGYALIRVTSLHLRHARQLVLRVHQVLVGRGYTGPAPTFNSEWTLLFG